MSIRSGVFRRAVAAVQRLDAVVARGSAPGSAFDRGVHAATARAVGTLQRGVAAIPREGGMARAVAVVTAAARAVAGAMQALFRAAEADRSGVLGGLTLLVASWLMVTLLWEVLALPPRVISELVSFVTPTTCDAFGGRRGEALCGLVLGLLTVIGALAATLLGLLLRFPIRRLAGALLGWTPSEATFLGPPLYSIALFTMGWAGVQYHVPYRPGIVSDGLFPVLFGMVAYGLARAWPLFAAPLRALLGWRSLADRRVLSALVVVVPIVAALVTTPLLNPPVRDQLVALVGLVVGYVLLAPDGAPAAGGQSLGTRGGGIAALAAAAGAATWFGLGGVALAAAGPCSAAFVLDPFACEAAHHGPFVAVAGAAIGGLAAIAGILAPEGIAPAAEVRLAAEDVRPRGSSFAAEPTLTESAGTRLMDVTNVQALYEQNIKAGKSPAEALAVAIAQQTAGMAGSDAFGGIADTRFSVAGGMLMGGTMTNALDAGSVAANFVGTGYDALAALWESVRHSGETGELHGEAFDRLAERVRDRPGADPLSGWALAAELLGEEWSRAEGDLVEDARRAWETGALGEQASESLEAFRARVASGEEGGALQGLNEILAAAAETYEDPGATVEYVTRELWEDARRLAETDFDAPFWREVADRNQAVADSVPVLGTMARGYGEIAAGIGDAGIEGFASEMSEGAAALRAEAARSLADAATRAAEATRGYLRSLFGGS